MKHNKSISWLHLSDLHIIDSSIWNLMRDGYRQLAECVSPNFIVLTGDFRDKKRGTSFDRASGFIKEIADIFHVTIDNIFLVPGNHDVNDYSVRKEVINYIIKGLNDGDPDIYMEYLANNEKSLNNSFTEFKEFVHNLGYSDLHDVRIANPNGIYHTVWNNMINIIGINSALISNGERNHDEIIDIKSLSEMHINNNYPTIALCHHDISNLNKEHALMMVQKLNTLNTKVLLCGDSHKTSLDIKDVEGTSFPCIVCGRSAAESIDKYSDFSVISYVSNADGTIKVQVYKWDKDYTFKLSNDFYKNVNQQYSFQFFDRKTHKPNSVELHEVTKPLSIWLPDAEFATGRQTRFNSFTKTEIIEQYLSDHNSQLGIASVKGIGKTFLLQVKRVRCAAKYRCLPLCEKPALENNWATEKIIFDSYAPFKTKNVFDDLVMLWKFSICCYVINNEKDNMSEKLIKNAGKELPESVMSLLIDSINKKLNTLMNNIVNWDRWYYICQKYYNNVKNICQQIVEKRKEQNIRKKRIAIFIDKIDQSIRQTNAEPPADCIVCSKNNSYDECDSKQKCEAFCDDEINGCQSRNCCYGCELFASSKSNTGLRIYEESNAYRVIHINIWQYYQLALMNAADSLLSEFNGDINVFYTMRQEAFQCETTRIGEQNQKIASHTIQLKYSRDDQKRIFTDSIREQDPFYLFDYKYAKISGSEEYAFVGIEKLCHPYCKMPDGNPMVESVFDSIYRHSFDRSRDIQRYGEAITAHIDEIRKCETPQKREEIVKNAIEELAAKLAYSSKRTESTINPSYYTEKIRYLPNYWADNDNFEKLLQLIDRNLLFDDDVKRICRQINGLQSCPDITCKNSICKRHPFSVLYNFGYLGYIRQNRNNEIDDVQIFADASDIGYFVEEDDLFISNTVAYIIHPALTKTIEKKYNKNLLHFSGFILGKNLPVKKDILKQLIKDKSHLPNEEFIAKYYSCYIP